MQSPTGLGIRVDREGDGHYGSRRKGGRVHKGTDFLCNPYQDIVAPFDLVVRRISIPRKNSIFSGIAWSSENMSGKMFYFQLDLSLVGHPVKQGDPIGVAQDVRDHYGNKMKPHIHFQIDSINPEILWDISKQVKRFGI